MSQRCRARKSPIIGPEPSEGTPLNAEPNTQGDIERGRLQALAAFLPVFESADFVFGHWEQPPPDEDGTMHFQYFVLSRDAESFIGAVGRFGWIIQGFDWTTWNATDEATALRTGEGGLSNASPQQLAQLLTALVRQNRFVEGALAEAYDDGLLRRIVARAASLVDEDRA